ncbi:MAG: DUF1624 domain-containing protein [Candidatus Izemoplasmatales bacterium]
MNAKRVWELDFLRGLSIILMVMDHFMYDLKSLPYWFVNYNQLTEDGSLMDILYKIGSWYWTSDLRNNFHFVFVAIFLLVSGISFTFSHSNLKRGFKFTIVALLITVVTMSVEYFTGLNIGIVFGIIHMFALGTIITFLIRKLWNNNYFVFFVGLAFILYGLSFDFINVDYVSTVTWDNIFQIIIGIKGYGADHFGIFPYTGVIMIGTVIGDLFYKSKQSLLPTWDKPWNKPFISAGKHTLTIFVLHQPVLFLIVYLLGTLLGYQF